MEKIIDHTYGTHIYMKMKLDNGRIEEIDVYFTDDGVKHVTSADHGMELYSEKEIDSRKDLRKQIISAFNFLY